MTTTSYVLYDGAMNEKPVLTKMEDAKVLAEWASAIEKEIAEISSSMSPLQLRLEAAKEKLDLIHRLMHLNTGPSQATPRPSQRSGLSQRHAGPPEIEDRIEELLREASKPLHISLIRDSLVQKGIPLPGRGDEANLILRIRRASGRFVRTGRGMYGLAEWHLPEYSPPQKRKRVRRKRISAQ